MWVMQSNHTDQLKSIQADHNSETRRLRAEIDKSWQILNKRDEQIVSIKAEFDKAFKDLEQRREEEFLRFQTASDAKARKSLHEKDEYYQRLLEVKINTDIAALRLQQQDTDRKETGDHAAAAGGHADPDSDPSESDSDQADRNKNSDKNRLKAKPDLVGKKKSPSRLGVGERAESADDGDSEGRDRGRRDRHNTDRNRKRAKTRHSGSSSPSPSRERQGGYLKPINFAGESPVETFLSQFETIAACNGYNKTKKAAVLKCSLRGKAIQVLWRRPSDHDWSFDQLVDALKARFGSVGQQERFQEEIRNFRRKSGETIASVQADICRLMTLAYGEKAQSELGEIIAVNHFLDALNNDTLALKVWEKEPKDLDSAAKLAVRLESFDVTKHREKKKNQFCSCKRI